MGALKVKVAGAWQAIVGPQGATGPQGAQGPPGPSGFPIGMPAPWLLDTTPSGFLFADGGQFDGTTYPALATLYGSTFGAISGNLYRLPNLTGRFLVGQNPADTASPDPLSALFSAGTPVTGGAKRVVLSANESGIRNHSHGVTLSGGGHEHNYVSNLNRQNYVSGGSFGATYAETGSTTTGGGGHTHTGGTDGHVDTAAAFSHQNLPPYYVCKWIIRATA